MDNEQNTKPDTAEDAKRPVERLVMRLRYRTVIYLLGLVTWLLPENHKAILQIHHIAGELK